VECHLIWSKLIELAVAKDEKRFLISDEVAKASTALAAQQENEVGCDDDSSSLESLSYLESQDWGLAFRSP